MRIHILNGAIPMAARGMSTQIQLAMSFIDQCVPFSRVRILWCPARGSTRRVADGNRLAACPAWRLAKSLDLRCGLGTTVGHDLLQDSHAFFEFMAAGRILRGLLGGMQSLNLELLLAEFEKAVECNRQHQRRQADHDEGEHNRRHSVHAFPPLSMANASMSRASLDG